MVQDKNFDDPLRITRMFKPIHIGLFKRRAKRQ